MVEKKLDIDETARAIELSTGDRHEIRVKLPTLHLAWTIDDGPTDLTDAMKVHFPDSHRPATWFITYDNLNKRPDFVKKYLTWQNELGHEIAIHGVHAKRNHLSWFPSADGTKENKKLESYDSIEDAMVDLEKFHAFLIDKGFKVRFVRLPYGLISELMSYLRKRGVDVDSQSLDKMARDIIAGKSPSNEKAELVKADFETMKKK